MRRGGGGGVKQGHATLPFLKIDMRHLGPPVLNRLVQFNVIRRYVKTNSIYTTHRLNALAAPPGIRV